MKIKTGPQVLATLGLFLTVLAVSIAFLSQNLEKIKESLGKNQNINKRDSQSVPELYYTMIGSYPSFGSTKNNPEQSKNAKYTVEINHFHKQRDASKMLEKLEKKGFLAFYTPLQNNNRVIYRVRQGVVDTKKEARRIAKELKKKTGLSGKVVKLQ